MIDTKLTQDETEQKAFEEYLEKASRNNAEVQYELGKS